MSRLEPMNLAAQLAYRGRGNPPSTHPESSIANCFPGLEFDFRAIWKHVFEGVELHEAFNYVIAVTSDNARNQGLQEDMFLLDVEGIEMQATVTGPRQPGGANETLGINNLEWTNALATIITQHSGAEVTCRFSTQQSGQNPITVRLTVRPLFEGTALVPDAAAPGALTEGLCSPWQADYRECGCYYWAASRPDFVNAEMQGSQSVGHNWMAKNRRPETKASPRDPSTRDSIGSPDQLSYEDLYQEWEKHLKFEIGGQDSE